MFLHVCMHAGACVYTVSVAHSPQCGCALLYNVCFIHNPLPSGKELFLLGLSTQPVFLRSAGEAARMQTVYRWDGLSLQLEA